MTAIYMPNGDMITSRTIAKRMTMRRIVTPDLLNQQWSDLDLQDWVAHRLNAHYPGWNWYVVARSDQGQVHVKCLEVSRIYGVRIGLGSTDTPAEWERTIVHAGGELLERAHQNRGAKPDSGRIVAVEGIEGVVR